MKEVLEGYRVSSDLASRNRVREAMNAALQCAGMASELVANDGLLMTVTSLCILNYACCFTTAASVWVNAMM